MGLNKFAGSIFDLTNKQQTALLHNTGNYGQHEFLPSAIDFIHGMFPGMDVDQLMDAAYKYGAGLDM